jgi:hypothetical protein
MPRFYFDVSDCGVMSPDDEGLVLPDLKAARKEALATLGSIAKDELPDGNRREFVVSIRDGSPKPVLVASLSLRVEQPS